MHPSARVFSPRVVLITQLRSRKSRPLDVVLDTWHHRLRAGRRHCPGREGQRASLQKQRRSDPLTAQNPWQRYPRPSQNTRPVALRRCRSRLTASALHVNGSEERMSRHVWCMIVSVDRARVRCLACQPWSMSSRLCRWRLLVTKSAHWHRPTDDPSSVGRSVSPVGGHRWGRG